MTYLLHSNAFIALLNGGQPIVAKVRSLDRREVLLSSIVLHELMLSAFKSARQEFNLARLEALRFAILAFDERDALESGRIRSLLRGLGTPKGPYDVLIAGQALARDLVLVTHNVREFSRVEGLMLEDWEA